MCFSASASFAASGVLTVIGGLCLREVKNWRQIALALLPFTFAIQQFCEGIDWLSVAKVPWAIQWASFATYLHVFVILFIWPFLFPLITLLFAQDRYCKRIAILCFSMGLIAVSLWMTEWVLPVTFHVTNCHLAINFPATNKGCFAGSLYVLDTMLSGLCWPIPWFIRLLGVGATALFSIQPLY